MSMRLRATLLTILIVFATTAATFFSGLYFTNSSLEETMEQDLAFAIDIADSLVGIKMDLMKTEAATIAARLAAAASREELAERMVSQHNEYPDVSALSVFTRDGVVASYSVPQHDHDLHLHEEYMRRVYDGGTIISSPFFCTVKGEYVMNVYTPMGSGRFLAVTMPGMSFSDILSKHRLWKSGSMFMLNEVGMFIGAADEEIVLAMGEYVADGGEEPDGGGEKPVGLIQKILSVDSGVDTYNFEGEERLCAYSRVENSVLGWRVAITVPLSESPQAAALQGQISASVFFLVAGIIAAFFLSRLNDRPFKEIEVKNSDLEKMNATIKAQAVALLEEHERVQIMLDATPLASRLWSRDIEIIDCNEAAVKLFGLKSKQEYIERYFDLSPEYQPDGKTTRDKLRLSVTDTFEKGSCTYEWMYRMPDGTPIPAENTMVRVPYGGDFVVAAYTRDLREQKKMTADIEYRDNLLDVGHRTSFILFDSAEDKDIGAALMESMELLGRCVDADRVHILRNETKDGARSFTFTYAWSNGLYGADASNVIGQKIPYSTAPDLENVFLQNECLNGPVAAMPPDMRKFYASFAPTEIKSVLVIPIFMQEQFWGLASFADCVRERFFSGDEEEILRSMSLMMATAVNRSEQAVRIREANNAKTNFLAQMSHEIRTPLNAVIGLSELTLGEENLGREAEANLEKIYGAGATILSIVNDILDISKIESGKFELYPVQYDTPSLVNDTVTLNTVRIGEKPIIFKLYADENLPVSLYGDDLRVKQIFNNLLSNAFKYTNSGTVEWRLSSERDGDSVWLVSSVEDTGIGITPENIKKLFSDYNQVDTRTNRRVEGTGLGLAITKRLVEMMDGNIQVESEYGKGSLFRIRLRQTFVSDTPIGKEVAGNLMGMRYTLSRRGKNTQLARVNLSYAHVLIVDDIATNLDVVKGMMKPYGMKIDYASSGQQAVEMIRSETPRYSAVFMDHMMPGMDGIEAVRIIRGEIGTEYARNIPVIALTANAILGNEEMFLTQGFQDFISKPIDLSKLDAVLRRWVRDKNFEKEFSDAAEAAYVPGNGKTAGGNGASPLALVTIDGLDKNRALERFGGDEAVFVDVLRSYAANTPPLLERLRAYLAEGNFTDYAIVAHGIKGSNYGIFAQEAGKAAEALEFAAREGRFDEVRAGHGAFEKNSEEALDGINRALSEIDAVTRKPSADAPDPGLLVELREACKAFDMNRVDAAMERLESFRYERGGELVAWLRGQINDMLFEAVSDGEWPSE